MALYFLTENYLVTQTPLTKSVDATEVIPFTKTAADLRIQPILGSYFYKYLLDKYNAKTLSTVEKELVALIKPAVAWRATGMAIIPITYQLKNKGLQKQDGEFSQSVDLQEAQTVRSYYEQMAEFYENQIIAYLGGCLGNSTNFPQFSDDANLKTSIIKPTQSDSSSTNIMVI